MKPRFDIVANGTPMGEFKGETEADALDAYARDAGYDDFADLLARVPGASREEIEVDRIDADKLFSAVEEKIGKDVFEDAYGDGIALVDGVSYATLRELANAHGLKLEDFYC